MPFLTFEGLDASGKSTLLKGLAAILTEKGIPVEVTCEPGGTDLGKELRALLLRTTGQPPCPKAELLIYEADRAQHVSLKIQPLLEKGFWVLSDRYSDSSLAFQGSGRGISEQEIRWLNQFATGGIKPELTILLDLTFEESRRRILQREKAVNQKADRFEGEKKDFHERIRNAYLSLAKQEPERWLILDGMKPSSELIDILKGELKIRGWL